MENTNSKIFSMLKAVFILFLLLNSASILQAQVWIPQMSGTGAELNSVWFTTAQNGWIVGDNGTSLFTINTGFNWIPTIISSEDMDDIAFKTQLIGLIVGNNGRIFRTSNAGIMWMQIPSGTNARLNTVSFGDNGNVFAAGEEGIILKSTNNGITWIRVDSLVGKNEVKFNSSSVKGTNFGIFAADGGIILVTTDGGLNFNLQSSGTDRDLRSVFFLDNMVGYTGGKEKTLLFTSNSGTNWISRNNGLDLDSGELDINGIFFLNSLTGFVVGDHGSIFRTTNSGMTWMPEISQTTEDLEHVFFFDGNHGWAVGKNGTIRFRGSINGIIEQNETATKFRLEQNYPNPFNPSTKIRFSLPSSEFVNLTIYDVTGKSVSTLVNSDLKAGVYEFQFDASNYPSGIYLYRLKTQSFSETRKMILEK